MDSRRELEAVVQAAIDGATVVTGNTRATRFLLSQCDSRLSKKAKAWSTPDILPFASWVQRCFRDAQIAGATPLVVLNSRQSLSLWKLSIADSPELTDLLRPASASGHAAQAWAQLHAFRIRLDSRFEMTAQSRLFASWARRYYSTISKNQWTDQARVTDEVRKLIEAANTSFLPKKLHLWECGELTPQQSELVSALRDAKVDVACHAASSLNWENAARIACDDYEEELRHAAEFARDILLKSEGRVGIVIPRLRELRARAEAIFTEVLHPEFYVGGDGARSFEISLGEPLADRPLVKTALQILRLVTGELPFSRFKELATSRYLGAAEIGERARLCRWLADKAPEQIDVQALLKLIDPGATSGREAEALRRIAVPRFRKTLAQLASPKGFPTKALMSDWATELGRLIRSVEWPGSDDEQLNSADFQSYKKWLELLSEIASLDVTQGEMTLAEAVEEIVRASSSQMFAPENIGARVQIMDETEAAGSLFEHLWVCGLDDESWPLRSGGSAFIPAQLLREAKVPGSTPESQVEEAARVMGRLLSSSDRVVLSYAVQDGERKLRMSPAIRDAKETSWTDFGVAEAESWIERMPAAALEELVDERAPAIADSELLHRGSSLLEKQAACPFRAFAELRLSATDVREPAGGIEATVRGNLIEDVLRAFWREARDSENCRGLVDTDRKKLVENAVDEALQKHLRGKSSPADLKIREIERERLIDLTEEWLQLEEKRGAFDSVRHQQEFTHEVAGVQLKGRIDRVDRSLTQQGEVIIDYKAGAGSGYSKRAWEPPRPKMPQLPLYAVHVQSEGRRVVGLGFGILNTAKSKFEGISTSKEVFGNNAQWPKWARPTLEEQIQAWAAEIERLVQEHMAGAAKVDPKVPPSRSSSTCQYCHLQTMCRVSESIDVEGDDEEDAHE